MDDNNLKLILELGMTQHAIPSVLWHLFMVFHINCIFQLSGIFV